MESRGISWKNRPVTIEVGFLLESASLTMRCQSLRLDDEVSESAS